MSRGYRRENRRAWHGELCGRGRCVDTGTAVRTNDLADELGEPENMLPDTTQPVTITKEIDFGIDYVRCLECSKELEFVVDTDVHGDIQIEVESHSCEG